MTRHSDPAGNEIVDVDCHVHAVSAKALLLSTDGEERNAVWIPKSQTSGSNDAQRDRNMVLGVKRWIAEREGLI